MPKGHDHLGQTQYTYFNKYLRKFSEDTKEGREFVASNALGFID